MQLRPERAQTEVRLFFYMKTKLGIESLVIRTLRHKPKAKFFLKSREQNNRDIEININGGFRVVIDIDWLPFLFFQPSLFLFLFPNLKEVSVSKVKD